MQEVKPTPNPTVISMLEELLAEAETGQVQGIAFAGSLSNAATFNQFVTGGQAMALVGEIAVMQRDVIDCEIDIRRKILPEYCE